MVYDTSSKNEGSSNSLEYSEFDYSQSTTQKSFEKSSSELTKSLTSTDNVSDYSEVNS